MCGISCIVALGEHTQRSSREAKSKISSRLTKSLEQIKHRGPDSSGQWISEDGRVALGHVRLEINDLTPTGAQPLHSNDGTIHAVVNGEIYDYDRLRSEMITKLNYRFGGTSDCELVLALYKFYGLSFLSHLRGEFSLCLYDTAQDLFIAVRDRYGIKPLFWTVQPNNELFIAAEMKAFLPLGWPPEWDVPSIVSGAYQLGSATIFKSVQKIRPGHILTCHPKSINAISESPYWDTTYPDKNTLDPRSESSMISDVRTLLLSSIRARLRADVKVGVSLSGGLDSSLVAGMTKYLLSTGSTAGTSERLSCFGIAFDSDSGFDESSTAERTAEFLGVKFYRKHMDEEAIASMFEDATWHDEQPNPDLNFIGTYALSELFRDQGVRVNVNGQGADEVAGGYNIFLPDFLREADTTFSGLSIPNELRTSELEKTEDKLNEVYGRKLNLTTSAAREHFNNILTPTRMSQAYPPLPIRHTFLPSDGRPEVDVQETYLSLLPGPSIQKIKEQWHPLHSAQYIFIHAHLPNLLLSHLGDRGEMAHSIEGRTPFLDHHFTEYLNGLPPSMKIRWDGEKKEWVEKYVLREAGREFLTPEVYTMRKHPYSAPIVYPHGGELWRVLRGLVTRERVERLGFLDGEGAERWLEKAFDRSRGEEGRAKKAFKLVICLAQWVIISERFGVMPARADGEAKAEMREDAGEVHLG